MHDAAQQRRTYFDGKFSVHGWWYFFPAVLAIKTSSALLLLAAGGVALSLRRWQALLRDWVFVLLPVGMYLGAAMAGNIQLGMRHILPVLPLLFLPAALALTWLASGRGKDAGGKSGVRPGGIRKICLLFVVLLPLTELAMVYPHYLAFFNIFVGGPRNGSKYLLDSNQDWGQDLILLKRWMDAHDVQHINLSYYGTADPAAYGITNCTHLESTPSDFHSEGFGTPQLPGYVAVSSSILHGFYSDEVARVYRPLLSQTPVAVIGFSIYVYREEKPWW
jgi:hypothetical protein